LINPEKSKENIAKVQELNKDIFEKITNSSGNWGTKDLKTLNAYNSLHPFAEYYAAGIKANPDFDAPELPYFAPGVSLARSILISKHIGLPVPMPVYPMQLNADVKKAKQYLGWEPKISLSEGTSALISWYKKERSWVSTIETS